MNASMRFVSSLVVIGSLSGCASIGPGQSVGERMNQLTTGLVSAIPTPEECQVSPRDPQFPEKCGWVGASRALAAQAVMAQNAASAVQSAAQAETEGTRQNVDLFVRPLVGISAATVNFAAAYANATINDRAHQYNDSQESIAKTNANSTTTIRLPDGPVSSTTTNNNLSQGQSQGQDQGQIAHGGSNTNTNTANGGSASNSNTNTANGGSASNTNTNTANGGEGGVGYGGNASNTNTNTNYGGGDVAIPTTN